MAIEIIKTPISRTKLFDIAKGQFGDFIKAVVDLEEEIMAIGGELHADGEVVLLQGGSKQENLWGINLYPEKSGNEWIEFDSMINIRPSRGNMSRGVEDKNLREKIKKVIDKLVQ